MRYLVLMTLLLLVCAQLPALDQARLRSACEQAASADRRESERGVRALLDLQKAEQSDDWQAGQWALRYALQAQPPFESLARTICEGVARRRDWSAVPGYTERVRLAYAQLRLRLGQDSPVTWISLLQERLQQPRAEWQLDAAYLLAEAYRHGDDRTRAEQQIRQALDLWAWVQPLQGSWEGYRGILVKQDLDALLLRIQAGTVGYATLQSWFDEAHAAFVRGHYPQADSLYAKVQNGDPEHDLATAAQVGRWACAVAQGKGKEVYPALVAFIQQQPLGRWRSQAHLIAGDVVLRYDLDPLRAAEHYAAILWPGQRPPTSQWREAASEYPDPTWEETKADAWFRWGTCQIALKQPQAALEAFKAELVARPTRSWLGNDLPNPTAELIALLVRRENPVFLGDVVQSGDRKIQTIFTLAACHAHAGDDAQAMLWFRRVLEDPSLKPSAAQRAYVYMEIAERFRRQADFKQALAYLARAQAEKPEGDVGAWVWYEISRIHYAEGNREEAIAADQGLLQAFPNHELACLTLYHLGYAYHWWGQPQEALGVFQQLLTRFPQAWETQQVRKHALPEVREALKQNQKEKGQDAQEGRP